MAHRQADQIRIYAETQRFSDNQRAQAIFYCLNITELIAKYRTCGIMKFTIKEKVKLSFDITTNADTIGFFIDI